MRNAWRFLFTRSLSRFHSNPFLIQTPHHHMILRRPQNPSFPPSLVSQNAIFRCCSSVPASYGNSGNHSLVVEIFSKPIGFDEIEAQLVAANLSIDHDTVNSVLRTVEQSPEIARKVFDWVSEKQNRVLSSKSYNLMLGILGSEGRSEDFWGLVEIMRKRGYGISKNAYLKALEGFDKKGIEKDSALLKEVYFLNSPENVVGRMCPRVCKILREGNEPTEIYNQLEELSLSLSSDLVAAVLERMVSYPEKALMFFRWAEGKPSFTMDARVYNILAKALGREDSIEEFRIVLQRMRNEGFGMEKETYAKVSQRLCKKKMIAEYVEVFEFAMNGSEKPQYEDLLLLLKKIVVRKGNDLDLISRAVRTYKKAGKSIKGSVFIGILKSLRSVERLADCQNILKAMEAGGFVPDAVIHNQVAAGLCDAGRLDEAFEYLDWMEKAGHMPDLKTWTSLIQRQCRDGDLDKALSCLHNIVERKGGEHVGCAFEVLVNSFCQKNKVDTAFKTIMEMVTKKQLKPWHSTYKFLIEKLVSQGKLKEASSLFGLMKGHGFPPFIEPFIVYLSKSGTADDALVFLKAMTVNEFPSRAVFLRIFETLLRAGRHEVAYDLLSISPGSVRNHADVLDLFYSMKPKEAAIAVAM